MTEEDVRRIVAEELRRQLLSPLSALLSAAATRSASSASSSAVAEQLPSAAVASTVVTLPSMEVMTADEAAEFLRVERNTVYDYANRGQIPHKRLGRRLLFSRSALVIWLGTCKITSRRKG